MYFRSNMASNERLWFCLMCLIIFVNIPEVRSRRLLKAGSELTADEMNSMRDKADHSKKHRTDADSRVKPSGMQSERESDKSTDKMAESRSEWIPHEKSSVKHSRENSDRRSASEWQEKISDKWSDVRSEGGSEETIESKKAKQSDTADRRSIYLPLEDQRSVDRFGSSVRRSSESSFSDTKSSSESTSYNSKRDPKSISSKDYDNSRTLEDKQSNSKTDISNKTHGDRTDNDSSKKSKQEDISTSTISKNKSVKKNRKENNKQKHRDDDYTGSGTRNVDLSLSAAESSQSRTKGQTHDETSNGNGGKSGSPSKDSNRSEEDIVFAEPTTGRYSEPDSGVTGLTRMVHRHTETSDSSTVLKSTTIPYTQPYTGTSTVPNDYPITKNIHTENSGTIYSKYTRKTFGTDSETVTKGTTIPINQMSSFGISTVSDIDDFQNSNLKEVISTSILPKSITSSRSRSETNFVSNKYTTVTPSLIIKPPYQGVPKCKRRTPPCCVSGELSLNLGTFRRRAHINGELEGVVAELSTKPQKRFIRCSNSAEIKISFEPMGNEGCFGCTSGPFCGRRMLQLDFELSKSKRRDFLFGISEASARNGDSIVYAKYPNIRINPQKSDGNGTGGIEVRGAVNAFTNKLTLFVGNQFIRVTSDRNLDESFCHTDLFHLNGQFDPESGGMSSNTITVWINKAPSSTEEYTGFGVCATTLKWACPWAELK